MCDLFVLSAGRNYSASRYLPVFAAKASRNMDGWGIGFFVNGRARVEKSAAQVYAPGRIHDSFQRLARVISSKTIICHVRLRTSGPVDQCHAHPFVLEFAGHQWIFAHNGRAPAIEAYRSRAAPLAEAVSDSARTFEFLRDSLLELLPSLPPKPSLFQGLLLAIGKLLDCYPGNYNFVLSNGRILFAFTNHRQFMFLRGSEGLEGALLLTTVEKGLSRESWRRLARPSTARGLLLAISGPDILLQDSVA